MKKKKREKKRVKVGHHGNNSVKFQAGWFSEGGVGVLGGEGKSLLSLLVFGKTGGKSPSFGIKLQINYLIISGRAARSGPDKILHFITLGQKTWISGLL